MKFCVYLFVVILITVCAVQAETWRTVPVPLSFNRADRVKRQWVDQMNLWSGWRCSGFNGLFLDCMGKK
uniref:Secreted protein n=1 Tax=Steinernema glaseri TaxID=37863 RepID=A0A1I7ZFT7_9BILA